MTSLPTITPVQTMKKPVIHSATITLKLPLDVSAHEEIEALRTAGIPVDALGNAKSGFLFMPTVGGGLQRRQKHLLVVASHTR